MMIKRRRRDADDASHLAESFFAHLDPFLADTDGQLLLSQGRCVDHLLDLYNATDNLTLREVISDVIDDIRHLSTVRADEMRSNLVMLAAVATVEAAFDAA
jgi:hypothetical protein